jgi:hypothetical protein
MAMQGKARQGKESQGMGMNVYERVGKVRKN